MRWSSNRLNPAVVAAFLTSVVILLGFIFWLVSANRPRSGDLNVSVGTGATPTAISVGVTVPGGTTPTVPSTVAAPPTPTSAPLATRPPEPTPTTPPTAPPPPTRPPPTAPPPTAAPPPPAAAPPPVESKPAPPPAPTEPTPPTAAAAPAPPGQANPPPQEPAPAAQPPTGPLAARPPAESTPGRAAPEPSPPGGIGNSRRDFEARYGPPVGRTPEGLDVFQTNIAELQVAFSDDRAERIRLQLRDRGVMALEDARNLVRGLIPQDAQPTATTGAETGRAVDQFRSVALGQAIPRSGGNLTVRYTPAEGGRYSGFEITLG